MYTHHKRRAASSPSKAPLPSRTVTTDAQSQAYRACLVRRAGEAAMSQRGQVLIVDDSIAIRRLLRELLEAEGYVVQEAADGLAAFLVLSRRMHRYVVLLDYVMPTLDGWKLLQLAAADS